MTKSQNSNSGTREIPIKEVREFSLSDDELRHQRIAEKAHELYQCRGAATVTIGMTGSRRSNWF